MRILSYNIYEGAHAEGLDRTEAVIKVIRAAEPDIVGLCECARFWDDGAVRLHRFESALGMRSVMNHAASDDNVTLLFRDSLPVVKADASGVMMYHGYARLVLNLPALGRVAVVMTHRIHRITHRDALLTEICKRLSEGFA